MVITADLMAGHGIMAYRPHRYPFFATEKNELLLLIGNSPGLNHE